MKSNKAKTGMKIPWIDGGISFRVFPACLLVLVWCTLMVQVSYAQDYSDTEVQAPPPEMNTCNGIFLSYDFAGREKEYPHIKNVSAQSWAFKATATIVNAGSDELKGWKMFIGFQHREILVSANGAVTSDVGDFPVAVGNGTTFTGYPQTDLKTAIETAGDFTQISATVEITGTLFGVKPPVTPMPRTIKLSNDGYQCPAPKRHGGHMHVCCKKNPKFKDKPVPKTKFLPRRYGDLNIVYDILQTYDGNYLAQVTIDNDNPLGRLDHWNLTWEWMRGEFISTMRGAYTHRKDPSECLYGKAGQFYKDLDFSQIMNCEKKPIISDLPADRVNDEKIGKLPYCCKNGTLLPTLMDPWKSRSIFQLQVYKVPPDMNRTAFYPPQKWKIDGVLNPQYKCGPPMRVDPTSFPDQSGLQATSFAVASWQIVCNITKPKEQAARCCVSFSAYYNDSAIPCNTCACGCNEEETDTCSANGQPMLLPPDALLVPFANRTLKARAWAKQKHRPIPKKMPCPDNCGVSINWHVNSDYNKGWTARVTIFNWRNFPFEDWFTAIDMGKASAGYENVYSFNGTRTGKNNQTLFFQGLKGLNYLAGQVNGTDPKRDPPVPGKQQTVVSFSKKNIRGLDIIGGDGFPKRVFFNGEECSLPKHIPKKNAGHKSSFTFLSVIFIAIITFLLITDHFHL